MLRRLLVVAALAAAAVPVAASAGGPQPPYSCHVIWVEVARTSPDLPYLVISRPEIVCYG
jgi:hypothetical protein